MNFPSASCPHCGDRGYNVTSLDDEFFRYMCVNLETRTPKCGPFSGARIPGQHKAEGKAQLDAYRSAYFNEVEE